MSAAEWIAERRRKSEAAPPLPYRYAEGAEGNPSNGPTYTSLEAEHPTHGWSEIARGDYDLWAAHGLVSAADACTSLPKALDALEAVLALWPDADPCDCCTHVDCEVVRAIDKALAPGAALQQEAEHG